MEKSKQISILKDLLRMLDNKENVDAGVMYRNPTSAYTCPDLAAKEWQSFFKGHTQLIGLSSDLPKAGSFLTMDDFGVPILATRGKDGQCKAFLNVCRHRGVQVEHEEKGTRSAFSCPFHQWTYSNQGDLIAIPDEHQFGAIDKSCHGLIQLPMEERHGMLWVHPNPKGVLGLDSMLEGLEDELSSWGFEKLVAMGQTTIAKRLNWKLANDTFGETYHFQKLHKNTLGKIAYGDCLNYETIGRNHRFVFPRRNIDTLREKAEADWRLTDGATTLYFLFPNIQFIIGNGAINIVRLYPDPADPNESITKINHFFTKGAIAAAAEIDGHGENVSADTVYESSPNDTGIPSLNGIKEVFNSTIEQEDYVMGETTQRAAETGLLDHVIFGRNEPALHHYHNTFRAALQMPPLEEVGGS
ncbi:MAG: aromatic ring-hydroxylating dioxygenase subunit alpha [Rhodospirillaceae bacterium]|nr:aromatic ring-hydroxylating dioxygenase subunit alpha [Rhodospirillaceae bacterium]MBT5193792.1 aromatic ring-hydroxylating dioxygenase subunit alpha [Rhodospirillaceae bacterium]MBT5894436.1 aromatic ring-hydroxylating dioxygenase subunit alpha [Rhodospirillaceae bacterium]MBT6430867.1 aromatic ring-hydroxylating dioxygenase subunit alpha [Rhodospirillaceae bacterium]